MIFLEGRLWVQIAGITECDVLTSRQYTNHREFVPENLNSMLRIWGDTHITI